MLDFSLYISVLFNLFRELEFLCQKKKKNSNKRELRSYRCWHLAKSSQCLLIDTVSVLITLTSNPSRRSPRGNVPAGRCPASASHPASGELPALWTAQSILGKLG